MNLSARQARGELLCLRDDPEARWDELGGFDEHCVPAYYEDTDLAFRVRRSGYDVIYQPACRVVHYAVGAFRGRDSRATLWSFP